MGYQNPITDKQLRYIEALAREAGLGGDAWDHFPGMSRSKAQRKATSADASAAIDELKELIETNKRRESLAEGEIDGKHVKMGGEWRLLSDSALAVYRELQPQLVGRLAEVVAEAERLKAAGDATPNTTAMRAVAGAREKTPREKALETVRALMAEYAIEISELGQ